MRFRKKGENIKYILSSVGKRRHFAYEALYKKRENIKYNLSFLSERGDISLMRFRKKKREYKIYPLFLSERGDSNARPLRPERSALPTALLSDFGSAKVGTFCEISKR